MRAAQLRSDGLVQIGSSPPAGADLAVGGSVSATGNISTSAALRANSLTAVSGTVVTATGDLTVVGTTRCDVLRGQDGTQVTCNDDFSVVGALTASGNVSSAGQVAAQTMFCQGNLTLNGSLVGWTPFFCAGRVNGVSATVGSSIGRVGYTVSRPSAYPTSGVLRISFASPAPNNNYVVSIAPVYYGVARLLDTIPPDVDGFHAVMSGSNWGLTNGTFHFSVTL
jgi:hypothetical protein